MYLEVLKAVKSLKNEKSSGSSKTGHRGLEQDILIGAENAVDDVTKSAGLATVEEFRLVQNCRDWKFDVATVAHS